MNKYIKNYSVILDNMDLFEYRLRPIAAIMYFQDAFARYTATKKMAAYDLFSKNQYWVIAEINMDFIESLPFWSEEIKVELWFSEVSKLKIYVDFNIYYKNKIVSRGNSLWFLINKDNGRPIKADEIIEKFEICDELALGEHKKFTLQNKNEMFAKIEHKINLSDLDFNNHVNNKSYINLAEMAIDNEFRKINRLKSLHVRFNRETFLGDVLICTTNKTEFKDTFVHVVEKDGVSVCDIETSWEKRTGKGNIVEYNLDVKNEG